MITELWHHWLLLRPLLGLVFAVVLLMLAVVFEKLFQPRRSSNQTHGPSLALRAWSKVTVTLNSNLASKLARANGGWTVRRLTVARRDAPGPIVCLVAERLADALLNIRKRAQDSRRRLQRA